MRTETFLIGAGVAALMLGLVPDDTTTYSDNKARLTLARTIYGEARGEGRTGMECVAQVILNRVIAAKQAGGMWWGNTIEEVCLKPYQFSCWNTNDPNRSKIASLKPGDNRAFDQAYEIAGQAIAGTMQNHIGFDVYHYKVVGWTAAWANGHTPKIVIGSHEFYEGVA